MVRETFKSCASYARVLAVIGKWPLGKDASALRGWVLRVLRRRSMRKLAARVALELPCIA